MIVNIRNSLFKSLNRLIEASSRTKYGIIEVSDIVQQERLDQQQKYEQMNQYLNNTLSVLKQGKDQYDQQKIDVYGNYLRQKMNGQSPDSVLEQLDKIDLLHRLANLESIIKDQGEWDEEQIQYEKLKCQAMLGDKKAQVEFDEVYKNKPFFKTYKKWTNSEEQLRHGLFN